MTVSEVNVKSFPGGRTMVTPEEVDQIKVKSRSVSLLIAVLGFVVSLLATVATAGYMAGNIQGTIGDLTKSQNSLTNAVNGLRDVTATIAGSLTGFRVEIDNMKLALDRERQERREDSRQNRQIAK